MLLLLQIKRYLYKALTQQKSISFLRLTLSGNLRYYKHIIYVKNLAGFWKVAKTAYFFLFYSKVVYEIWLWRQSEISFGGIMQPTISSCKPLFVQYNILAVPPEIYLLPVSIRTEEVCPDLSVLCLFFYWYLSLV